MKRNQITRTPNFWGLARNYLHHYLPRVRAMSTKTVEAYRICLECYIAYLSDDIALERKNVTFDHLDRPYLKRWLVWMREKKNYKPSTIALRLSAVKAFLKYASGEDMTLVILYEKAKTLKAPAQPRKPIDYLEENHTKALLGAFDGATAKSRRNRMVLILLYESAARVSEIVNLTLSDLTLTKPAHVTLDGKRDKSRVVPLSDKAVQHLEIYLDEFHPRHMKPAATRPLFYSHHHGEPLHLSVDTISVILKKAGRIAKRHCPSMPDRLHCHMIRKTKAMDLYKQGVPLPLIMQLLGHESMSTTSSFYAFATFEMMRKAMDGANPVLSSADHEWLSEEKLQLLYTLK